MKNTLKAVQPFFVKATAALLLMASLGSTTQIQAQLPQSQLWTIPPNKITFNSAPGAPTALPTSSTIGGYQGGPTSNPSNCYYDQYKKLLFFIVDGVVYDGSGLQIGPIMYPTSSPTPAWGFTEIEIIPVPGACKKFYLVTSAYTNTVTCATGANPSACYVTLDVNTKNYGAWGNPNAMGTLLISGSGGNASLLITPGTFDGVNANQEHNSSLHLGTTTLRSATNNRLLFVSDSYGVYLFLVDNTGINPLLSGGQQVAVRMPLSDYSGLDRNQLVVAKTSSGNYRVAVGYSTIGQIMDRRIFISDFDPNGNPLSASSVKLPNNGPGNLSCITKGLEFSPDANTLYVAHEYYPFLEYINLANYSPTYATPVLVNMNNITPNAADFHLSQIARGYDGNLYFACADAGKQRMASLSFPNSPGSAVFTDYVTGLTNAVVPIGEGCDPTNSTPDKWVALLPDQIDGEDYNRLWNSVSIGIYPTTICSGSCLNLSYTTTYSDPVQVSYLFNNIMHYGNYTPGANSTGTFGNWCPAATQTYTVTPIVPAGSGYCETPTVLTINVTPLLNPNFTMSAPNFSNGSQTTCTMTATPIAYTAGSSFWWDVQEVTEGPIGVWTTVVPGSDMNSGGGTTVGCNAFQWYWSALSCNFNGYVCNTNGTYTMSTCNIPYPQQTCTNVTLAGGTFLTNHSYRITRAGWMNGDPCNPWTTASLVVHPTAGPGKQFTEVVDYHPEMPAGLLENFQLGQAQATAITPIEAAVQDLIISPNPSNGLVNIAFGQTSDEKVTVTIINSMGQVVEQRDLSGSELNANFDLGIQAKGIYLVKLTSRNKLTVKKLILQ